jgi:hypothetical protein
MKMDMKPRRTSRIEMLVTYRDERHISEGQSRIPDHCDERE